MQSLCSSFSYLIVQLETSNAALNFSGENDYPSLIPNIGEKSIQIFTIKYNQSCRLYVDVYEVILLISTFLRVCFNEHVLNFVDYISTSIVMMIVFFLFCLILWLITLTGFLILNQYWISRINSKWLWWIIIFAYYWIWFASILFKIFVSVREVYSEDFLVPSLSRYGNINFMFENFLNFKFSLFNSNRAIQNIEWVIVACATVFCATIFWGIGGFHLRCQMYFNTLVRISSY